MVGYCSLQVTCSDQNTVDRTTDIIYNVTYDIYGCRNTKQVYCFYFQNADDINETDK